jgi:pyruvate dehydrogenase (quinone)
MLGFKGIRVDNPQDIGPAWEEAFAADCPVVIEFIADPDVPPLPPHISWSQARAYMTALGRGDPNEAGIVRQTLREILAGVLPE